MLQEPIISTTVLSWNRASLLTRTLYSYIETISVPHELFIVDNASTDESRDAIRRFLEEHPECTAILLDNNLGGDAVNFGLERSRGSLLHISENDIEYLPGWDRTIVEDFEAFPQLGQLSVFGPVPTDDEAWDVKPCSMRHCGDRIVYVTDHNVGASSVISRTVWDKGLRLHNYPTKDGSFLFPDDGRLSAEIRGLGLWVAWAHKYLVRNLGHMGDEMEARPEYYLENYRSKDWYGIEGFRKRMERWHSQVRPVRKSFLFGEELLSGEKSLPSPECPFPQRWSMIDGNTAEIETLEFLYSIVRLLKPGLVIETGAWHGYSAVALGKALRQNGFGRAISFEMDSEASEIARRRVREEDLSSLVEVSNASPLESRIDDQIDMLVLDSELTLRAPQFEYFRSQLRPGAIVIFHDTGTNHRIVRDNVARLTEEGLLTTVTFPSPRGIAICQYPGSPSNSIND
jgi:predicted O-methyltransferase YrrM